MSAKNDLMRRHVGGNVAPDVANRAEYRKDHDRVFYSAEFERLEGVTQVATVTSRANRTTAGRLRNRLTHSYRVEQIAQSLASRFANESRIDVDVVSTAALLHDIGHAPFGHTGEQALQEAVTCDRHRAVVVSPRSSRIEDNILYSTSKTRALSCSDNQSCLLRDGFEGNAQSFRIATLLGSNHARSEVHGFNLTRRSLWASLKYPWYRGDNKDKPRKWGVYDCDYAAFEWVRSAIEGNKDVQGLEASLMDLADDIAYAIHDLEDFYEANMIPLSDVVTIDPGSPTFMRLIDYLKVESEDDDDDVPSPIAPGGIQNIISEFELLVSKTQVPSAEGEPALFPWQGEVSGPDFLLTADAQSEFPYLHKLAQVLGMLPTERYVDSRAGRQFVSEWRGDLISLLIGHTRISVDDSRVEFDSEEIYAAVEFLKQLTWYFVIDDSDLASIRDGQMDLVKTCFSSLFRNASIAWLTSVDENAEWHKAGHKREQKRVPERLRDYIAIGKAMSVAEVDVSRRYLPREVVARAVVDYICSLEDDELYDYSLQVGGAPSHAIPRSL